MRGLKLLVVDDDPTFLGIICAVLKDRGCHAIPCSIGEDLLELAVERMPDAILLDAYLRGGVDGLNLCSSLKRNGATRNIPVLMMSGMASGDYVAKAIDSGASCFLEKPFDVRELERRLREAVSGKIIPGSKTKPGPRILWLEDDDEYRQLGLLAFRHASLDVTAVPSLAAGRRALARETPDIIILDASLPDGSGIDFCREIRTDRRFERATIAILTGQRKLWDHDGWFAAGADQCWLKTPNCDRLVALVRGVWRRQSLATDSKPAIQNLSLNAVDRVLIYKGVASDPLSPHQLAFFDLLWKAHPNLVSREAVQAHLTRLPEVSNPKDALNMLVKRLREKLPSELADAVETVRGYGYRLVLP